MNNIFLLNQKKKKKKKKMFRMTTITATRWTGNGFFFVDSPSVNDKHF